MRSSCSFLLVLAGALALTPPCAHAQYARPKIAQNVGIDQKLNSPVPLDLVFKDELGQTVPLRTYFGDKPVVLELVWFNCKSLCPMSLMESVNSLNRLSLVPGRDYDVVVASIDPHDTPAAAADLKAEYSSSFKKPGYTAGFHFLTGSQESITRLAEAVGFRYHWDEASHQFVHAGGIMVATPEGKLSRYFYGIQYAPQDLRMALVDAAKHKIGTPIDYVLLFCFHYDATEGKYTLAIFNIVKFAGCATLLALLTTIFFFMRNDKNEVRHAG